MASLPVDASLEDQLRSTRLQLLELKSLHDQMLISDVQYEAKQNLLLGISPEPSGSDSDSPSSKRLKLVPHDLIPQHPLTTVNTCVDIHQKKLAGFAIDQCRVFVRPESVALWTAMENAVQDGQNLRVSGPPGTGKSTEALAWALWKAQDTKKKVVWFHFSQNRATKVVIDGASDQITAGHSAKIADIEASAGDFLVIDGVTKKDSVSINRACSVWRDSQECRAFVTVSSVSIPVAVQEDEEAKIRAHTVPSWSLEQYQQACQDDTFFNSVKDNLKIGDNILDGDLILAKYAYAGGSARWMFEFDMQRFHTDFKVHFDKVKNYTDIFGEAGGDTSADAVNHLRGLTITPAGEHNYFFISQYATRRLSAKCDDERQFIIDGYNKASEAGNPAFRGWIFEFDVDYQLKQACQHASTIPVVLRVHPNEDQEQKEQKEERKVNEYVTFQSRDDLLTKLKSLSANEYLWAKPELWCQKSFDFLRFHRQDSHMCMVAVNASHAKKHSVLLSVVSDLGTVFGAT